MATLLKIVIVLLLVLSIVALGLSVKLFNQREVLKGRTQTLEKSVIDLAKNVEAETAEALITKGLPTMDTKISKDSLMTYYRVDPKTKQRTTTGPGTMNQTLKDLVGRATVQLSRLNDTRDSLGQVQQALVLTNQVKQKAEADLVLEKKLTKEQEQKIATQEEEVKQANEKVTQLEEGEKTLKDTIEDQKGKLTKCDDEKMDLEQAKRQTEDAYKKLEAEMARRETERTAAAGGVKVPPPGLKGQVLIVDPKWNFVVLGVPKDSELSPLVELIVQRQDKFVGKIRISEVKPEFNLAVAEIMDDWKQLSIQEGDYVFY